MTLGLAVFAAVFLAVAIVAGRLMRDVGHHSRAPLPVGEEMALVADQAIEAARDAFDTSLDYTPDSLQGVEGILARLHEEHQTRPFFPERLAGEANRWGAYIGEVARRAKGGRWQRDSAHVGERTYPLVLGEQHEIYPCAWCFRRITNGPEDNVWDKFRAAVLNEGVEAST